MINGKIDAEIPGGIAKLPNWKAPIHIAVHKGEKSDSNSGGASRFEVLDVHLIPS